MRQFVNGIKAIIRLVLKNKDYLKGESYYPDEPHKSKVGVFLDQLYFILKSGNIESFYYTYGFDRKSMYRKKCIKEYIINEDRFLHKVDNNNNHLKGKPKLVPGRVILADKFYFFCFLRSFGFPTPKILYYFRNGAVFYSFEAKNVNYFKNIGGGK